MAHLVEAGRQSDPGRTPTPTRSRSPRRPDQENSLEAILKQQAVLMTQLMSSMNTMQEAQVQQNRYLTSLMLNKNSLPQQEVRTPPNPPPAHRPEYYTGGASQSCQVPLPDELKKLVDKAFKQYKGLLLQRERTERRVATMKQEIELMSSPGIQYPRGVKPYRTSDSFLEMDNKWSATSTSSINISCPELADFALKIEQGSSRKAAALQVHHALTTVVKAIEFEAVLEHLDSLKSACTKDKLFDVLNTTCTAWVEDTNAKHIEALKAVGVHDPPPKHKLDIPNLMSTFEGMYRDLMEHQAMAAQRKREGDLKARQEQERKDKELERMGPQEIFQAAVRHIVRTETAAGEVDHDMTSSQDPLARIARLFKEPKNSNPPKAKGVKTGRPTHGKSNPKGNKGYTKGKVKGQPKGSPKGKLETQKGKPKGKGKGTKGAKAPGKGPGNPSIHNPPPWRMNSGQNKEGKGRMGLTELHPRA